MDKNGHLVSMFSSELDRSIYLTYFLGSIAPLAALAWVVHHYAIPSIYIDGLGGAGLIFMVVGIGALSLGGFMALHRLTAMALPNAAKAGETAPTPATPPAAPSHDQPTTPAPQL